MAVESWRDEPSPENKRPASTTVSTWVVIGKPFSGVWRARDRRAGATGDVVRRWTLVRFCDDRQEHALRLL
jgi:hypothetical protein